MVRFLNNKILILAGCLSICSMGLIGCSADEKGLDFGRSEKKGANQESAARQETVDLQQTCGLQPGATSNPGQQVFQQTLASLPIVVEGASLGIGYRVTTAAQLSIQGLSDQTIRDIQVQVSDVQVTSNPLGIPLAIAKSKAKKAAEGKSGTITAKRMVNGDWLNLVSGTNTEYNGLFCGVAATTSVTDNTGEEKENGQVEFTPALVNNINPNAPRATFDKELATPRIFHVTANVTEAKKDWTKGSQTGTITIAPIAPTAQVNGQSIASDVAFEIRADFPGGSYKVGLSRSQKFFINTSTHTIEVIIDDTGSVDPQSKRELPPTVLIRR